MHMISPNPYYNLWVKTPATFESSDVSPDAMHCLPMDMKKSDVDPRNLYCSSKSLRMSTV